jgi:tetratricopeptide (TPR) repeat protein
MKKNTFTEGFKLHQAGRIDEAQHVYNTVLMQNPNHFDSLHLSGVIDYQNGNLDQAFEKISKALLIKPENALALSNLGSVLNAMAEFESALVQYDKSLNINPRGYEVWSYKGNVLQTLGRIDEAKVCHKNALSIEPNYAVGLLNIGAAYLASKEYEYALNYFYQALARDDRLHQAWVNIGFALNELKRFSEAKDVLENAIAINRNVAEAYLNRGIANHGLGCYVEAINDFTKAINLRNSYPEAWYSIGVALRMLEQFDDADKAFDVAIQLNNQYGEAYLNKSHLALLRGKLSLGFELFEWRWKAKSFDTPSKQWNKPLWLGRESLEGKTILIHAEQGLGDTIQFCRYITILKEKAGRVLFAVPKPLLRLMKLNEVAHDMILEDEEGPAFDYQAPLLSLPHAFRTEMESIPTSKSYLNASDVDVRYWQSFLKQKKALRIGLVWSSVSSFSGDSTRSMMLEEFVSCLDGVNAEFHCLQKHVKSNDVEFFNKFDRIIYHGDDLNDLADTAALIKNMDLVISTCTSIPHLSAALGVPTWVIIQRLPDWRWLLDRNDSPWYPSVRLYRQSENGSWQGVLTRIREDLQKLLVS